MNYEASIIVDMLTALIGAEPYNRAFVLENIKALSWQGLTSDFVV